ncbi:MAG: PIN domain-containing protein [Candidatus Competibacteraceae bacterium]
MPGIVVDSGPLIALFDGSDQYHSAALRFVERNRRPLITNLPVITEVVYVLDFSGEAQRDFLFWAQQALTIDAGTVNDLDRIRTVLENYADLPADFADASLVALCERLKVWHVASVDSDFTIYRGRDKRRFSNRFFES